MGNIQIAMNTTVITNRFLKYSNNYTVSIIRKNIVEHIPPGMLLPCVTA